MNHSRCPNCGVGQDQIVVSRPYPVRPPFVGADHICLACGFGWHEHIHVNNDQYQIVFDVWFDVHRKVSQVRYEQSLEEDDDDENEV